MEWPKNTNSDITAALEKYGICDFLILGLQEVPGTNERREIWGLSTQDLKKFREGLMKLLADRDGPRKLLVMIFAAIDLQRKLAEAEALLQKEEGKA